MLERWVALIGEYRAKILEAAALFRRYKGVDSGSLMFWRRAGLPIRGFLDSGRTVGYYFHGNGCRVSLPGWEVDWDFGHDGRLDGFDAWRLWQFAKDGTDQFPEFERKETLEDVFREALARGVIHRPFKHLRDDLYYLRIGFANS